MSTFYFTIGLIYIILGFAVTLVFYYGFKKKFPGNFIGAVCIGIIGSFLGGFIDYFFGEFLLKLAHVLGTINIFPPLFTATFFLWLFHRMENSNDD